MNLPEYYLNENFFIKLIDFPAVYNIKSDEIYCLDEKALKFLQEIEKKNSSSASEANNERVDSINYTHKERDEIIKFCLDEGILTTKKTRRLHPKIKQSPLPSLRYLELQITKRCNLRCKHCFVGESSNIDLSVEQITKVFREFEDMQGLRVLITGGEPLLHPEFERINQILPNFAVRKILFTNGILLTDEWLKKLNVQEIQISLDGLKKGHESLRGKGSFHKAVSAIKRAIEYGFDVSVATMIHRKNLYEFEELEELIKNLKVRDWTVDALTLSGNLKLNREFWVEPRVAGKIMEKYGFTSQSHPKVEGFGCGAHLLAILATGQAAYCSFFEESPIGNIDEGLEKLWKKKKIILLKELECSQLKCAFLHECFGGCRYRAFSISGEQTSPDSFKCYQFLREK